MDTTDDELIQLQEVQTETDREISDNHNSFDITDDDSILLTGV